MKTLSFIFLCLFTAIAQAAPSVFRHDVQAPMPEVYQQLYQALESKKLWVVFEPNMGQSIAGMAERLGDNYNRNGLQGIRSLVTCNAWYANEVSNLDPNMLALCPLHITLIQRQGSTRVLFVRPTHVAQGSAAEAIAQELEQDVAKAIEQAVKTLGE